MATYDAAHAQSLLELAVSASTDPVLSADQVMLLMSVAGTPMGDGTTVYESAGLNRAAALGWRAKAGLVASKYELGGGGGKYLKQQQVYEHCIGMAAAYESGTASVDGSASGAGKRSLGVITLTSAKAGYPYE